MRQLIQNSPAQYIPEVHRLIRSSIGFDGLLMSDDLSMEALGGTVKDSHQRAAIAAGCDIIVTLQWQPRRNARRCRGRNA